jgi:hypothetical protein
MNNSDFIPDYKPEEIQDAYNAIYGHYVPREIIPQLVKRVFQEEEDT